MPPIYQSNLFCHYFIQIIMLLIISLFIANYFVQALESRASCFPSLSDCQAISISFKPAFAIPPNSYIYFELPFDIYSETFTLQAIDETSFPQLVLSGGPYFKVTTFINAAIWYKGFLSLATVFTDGSKIGPFQFKILSSLNQDAIILDLSVSVLAFQLSNKPYAPPPPTLQPSVVPALPGVNCQVNDWAQPIKKNKFRQLTSFSFQVSENVTTDRLDLEVILVSIPPGFTFHRECYVTGPDLPRSATPCFIRQAGATLKFQMRATLLYLLKKETTYMLEFYISHIGATIQSVQFTSQFSFNSIIIDICATPHTFTVDSADYPPEQITEASLYISTPNQNAPTMFGLRFHPRSLDFDTQIKIELGFLKPSDDMKCTPYQVVDNIYTPSLNFDSISVDSNGAVLMRVNKESSSLTDILYSLNCTGVTLLKNTQNMRIIYQDFYQTIISKADIRYPLNVIPESATSEALVVVPKFRLLEKMFNHPCVPTVITLEVVPDQDVYRAFVELAPHYTYTKLKCLFQGLPTVCRGEPVNKNRIIVQIQQAKHLPVNSKFNLTIIGLVNPKTMPYNSKIYILLDDDNSLDQIDPNDAAQPNGVFQIGSVDDFLSPFEGIRYLESFDFEFSEQKSRTYRLHLRGQLQLFQNSVKEGNLLIMYLPDQFQLYQLNCTLIKQGDANKNNFISSCKQINGYLEMPLKTDTGNSRFSATYTLNISTIRTTDIASTDLYYKYLQPQITLQLTDKSYKILLYSPQLQGKFNLRNTLIHLHWFIVDKDGTYKILTPNEGEGSIPEYDVSSGFFTSQQLFLGHQDYSARFNTTVILHFPQIEHIIFYGTSSLYARQHYTNEQLLLPKYEIESMNSVEYFEIVKDSVIKINPGDTGYWFSIAADKLISGVVDLQVNFTIVFPSRDSWNPVYYYNPYAEIPRIRLKIVEKTCDLVPEATSYQLPKSGFTQNIIVDSSDCIPLVERALDIDFVDNNALIIEPIQLTLSMKRLEQFSRALWRVPAPFYVFRVKATALTNPGVTTNFLLNKQFTIQVVSVADPPVAPLINPLIGSYAEIGRIVTLNLGCSQVGEVNLIIAINEVEDSEFAKLSGAQLSGKLEGSHKLFQLSPNNQSIQDQGEFLQVATLDETKLIKDLYQNSLIYQVAGAKNTVLKQVNQSNLQDLSQRLLVTQVRNMQMAKANLIEKSSQLQLQRILVRMNYFGTSTFILKNLKPDTHYSFAYFCRNLINNVSEMSQHFLHTPVAATPSGGGYLFNITFIEKLSPDQQNNVLCAISQYYKLNYHQVLDVSCNQCDGERIYYKKMNYTEYLRLVELFVPFDLRTPADQQRYTDNLFTMSIYLNNYKSSAGLATDFSSIVGGVTNDTVKLLLNVTDDLEIQFKYLKYSLTELNPVRRTLVELAKQLVIESTAEKNENLLVDLRAQSNLVAFVGLHKLEPLFEQSIKHPSGLLLRRGLLGSLDRISEGVQHVGMAKDGKATVQFSNLQAKERYILYWSSSELQNDCLSRQYSDTGFQIIRFVGSNSKIGWMIGILWVLLLVW